MHFFQQLPCLSSKPLWQHCWFPFRKLRRPKLMRGAWPPLDHPLPTFLLGDFILHFPLRLCIVRKQSRCVLLMTLLWWLTVWRHWCGVLISLKWNSWKSCSPSSLSSFPRTPPLWWLQLKYLWKNYISRTICLDWQSNTAMCRMDRKPFIEHQGVRLWDANSLE